ncbi:hypothetical protein M9458_050870, partial [Cirrhinus mrigala]
GANFRGGECELTEAFAEMEPSLREQLANQKMSFIFNPPLAPHFFGVWEREIKSVKASLQALKDHTVPEEVLNTVLIMVEDILNSKPLEYVSSDIVDPDPITPNLLLMLRKLPNQSSTSTEVAEHYTKSSSRSGCIVCGFPTSQSTVDKVTRVLPSDDRAIKAAEADIKGNTYIHPAAKLSVLPEMPEDYFVALVAKLGHFVDLQISCVNLWGGCTKFPASCMRESKLSRLVWCMCKKVFSSAA